MRRNIFFLYVELVVMFVGLPLLFAVVPLNISALTVISTIALFYLVVLLHDNSFHKRVFSWHHYTHWRNLFLRFLLFIFMSFPLVVFVVPGGLFSGQSSQVTWWFFIFILYPLLSVLPQTIIYRVYFFHRFRDVLPKKGLILLNAFLFSFLHVIYHNWFVLALTFVGGLIFATTYLRSKSFIISGFEHSLYGCWLFVVGLGGFLSY